MSQTVKIGYMGIPLSNCEAMAVRFSEEMGIRDPELVPLMDAEGVVDALLGKKIDLGVLATENSTAGPVIETEDALRGHGDIVAVRHGTASVHHCVFVKDGCARVTKVCSHIQALHQCRESLKRLYPDAEQIECSDTAYAAEMLSDGRLSADCAVICRKAAGEHYGLRMIEENIEDDPDNATVFAVMSLRTSIA